MGIWSSMLDARPTVDVEQRLFRTGSSPTQCMARAGLAQTAARARARCFVWRGTPGSEFRRMKIGFSRVISGDRIRPEFGRHLGACGRIRAQFDHIWGEPGAQTPGANSPHVTRAACHTCARCSPKLPVLYRGPGCSFCLACQETRTQTGFVLSDVTTHSLEAHRVWRVGRTMAHHPPALCACVCRVQAFQVLVSRLSQDL